MDLESKPIDPNNHSVWSNLTDSVSIPNQNYETTLNGLVLQINSLDEFYLQTEDADETLMNMKIEAYEKYEKHPKAGTSCVVNLEDDQFYRARILDNKTNSNTSICVDLDKSKYSTGPKLKVLLIDYGNVETVTLANVYKMSPEIKAIKPQAFSCQLNFSETLKSWLRRTSDETSEGLIKCFKNLTSKSKVQAKVIEFRSGKALVDLFIENQNICDKLLLNGMSLLKPIQVKNIDSSKSSSLAEINQFDAYLINPDAEQFFKTQNTNTEMKVLNVFMLNKVCDDVDLDVNKECIKDEICSLAPLPDKIKSDFNLTHRYGRVFVHTEDNAIKNSKKKEVLVNFIDLGYQKVIEKCMLVHGNGNLSKMPPSVEKYNLNLENNHDLTRLSSSQLMHLSEIFKMLIFYEPGDLETNESSNNYSYSCKLKARVIQTNNSSFSNIDNAELRSMRLFDEERQHLDINYIIEKCICLMVKDFKGHLINLEADFSRFDCLNKVSKDLKFVHELNKIYRSLKRFESVDADSDDFEKLTLGNLCLIDSQKTSNQTMKGTSIIDINDMTCMDADSTEVHENELKDLVREEDSLSRCMILEENDDKCHVYNVDNGKQLSVNKKRLRSIDMSERFNLVDRRYMSCALIKILPFMIIKAKPEKEITDPTIQEIIHKSHIYKETIRLSITGSYSSTLDCFKNNPSLNTEMQVSTKNSFSQFIQTQKDLFKKVDLRHPIKEEKLKSKLYD